MRLRSETITAVAATVTAIAAVAIAAWDNVQTREHNRLSVSPRLTIDLSQSTSQSGSRYAVTVRNDGIGPALITDMELRFEAAGETIETASWDPIVARFIESGHPVDQTWLFRDGDAIAVDRSFTLLGVNDRGEGTGPSLGALVGQLHIAIDYESIYGDSLRSEFNFSP